MKADFYVPLPEAMPLRGHIFHTGLEVPDELDDLNALKQALFIAYPEYKKAPTHEVMKAIRRGMVPKTRSLGTQGGHNLILRGFYNEMFARLSGSPTAAQTLAIEYFAVGTLYDATVFADSQLGNEIYRAVPNEFYDDTVSTFYATTYLKKSQGNPNTTTVSSSTSTVVTVASATGIQVNTRIQVETSTRTYLCTVSNVASTALTVTDITDTGGTEYVEFPADDIPQSADVVYVLHCEAAIFLGDNATASANTGVCGNRKRFGFNKKASVSVLYDFVLACTSIDV